MRLTSKSKKDLHDAYFMAGFGGRERVQINKTTDIVITVEDGNVMNPPTAIDVYKNGKFQKRYYVHSERECIAAIQKHK